MYSFGAMNAAAHRRDLTQGTKKGKKIQGRLDRHKPFKRGEQIARDLDLEAAGAERFDSVTVAQRTREERKEDLDGDLRERNSRIRESMLGRLAVVESYCDVVLGNKVSMCVMPTTGPGREDCPCGASICRFQAVPLADVMTFVTAVGWGHVEKGGYYPSPRTGDVPWWQQVPYGKFLGEGCVGGVETGWLCPRCHTENHEPEEEEPGESQAGTLFCYVCNCKRPEVAMQAAEVEEEQQPGLVQLSAYSATWLQATLWAVGHHHRLHGLQSPVWEGVGRSGDRCYDAYAKARKRLGERRAHLAKAVPDELWKEMQPLLDMDCARDLRFYGMACQENALGSRDTELWFTDVGDVTEVESVVSGKRGVEVVIPFSKTDRDRTECTRAIEHRCAAGALPENGIPTAERCDACGLLALRCAVKKAGVPDEHSLYCKIESVEGRPQFVAKMVAPGLLLKEMRFYFHRLNQVGWSVQPLF